ncbi:MAG: PRTRC system protein C [Chloroflexota bacterium]
MTDPNTHNRIFKIGTTIVEDESMTGLDLDGVKQILQRSYPEVAHATVRETTLEDGSTCYHFINRPGRKG